MPYIRNIWQILPWSNLLNEVLHFGFTVSIKQWTKEKKKMIPFWGKKQEKQNSATTIVWIKILKQEFQKRSNEFSWGKSPDYYDLWSFCFKQ